MESAGDISAWITPAIIIGLFLWLRADLRALEGRFEQRFDAVEKRLDGVELRLGAVEVGPLVELAVPTGNKLALGASERW